MKYFNSLIIRLILCLIPLELFYIILTPLTVYGSYLLILPLNPHLNNSQFVVHSQAYNIVKPCVAGFAYYFFFLLTMLTKEIKPRIKLIIFGFFLIFLMNIIRIALLIYIGTYYGPEAYESLHIFFWKFVSGIYVAFVWIILVKYFKITSIPVYDDLKELYKHSYFFKKH